MSKTKDEQKNGESDEAALKRWDRVHRLKRQVQKYENEWSIKKNDAAAAKKRWDKKLAELMRAIDEAHNGQDLLFDEDGEPTAATNGHPAGKTPLSAIGLTEKQVEKFAAAEIGTVEELEARMASDEWWHRKIKGVGESTIDKISDKLVEYRKAHPVEEPATEQPTEQPTEAAAVEW